MFRGHHRKVRLLFGLSDLVLIAAAFVLAYQAHAYWVFRGKTRDGAGYGPSTPDADAGAVAGSNGE